MFWFELVSVERKSSGFQLWNLSEFETYRFAKHALTKEYKSEFRKSSGFQLRNLSEFETYRFAKLYWLLCWFAGIEIAQGCSVFKALRKFSRFYNRGSTIEIAQGCSVFRATWAPKNSAISILSKLLKLSFLLSDCNLMRYFLNDASKRWIGVFSRQTRGDRPADPELLPRSHFLIQRIESYCLLEKVVLLDAKQVQDRETSGEFWNT